MSQRYSLDHELPLPVVPMPFLTATGNVTTKIPARASHMPCLPMLPSGLAPRESSRLVPGAGRKIPSPCEVAATELLDPTRSDNGHAGERTTKRRGDSTIESLSDCEERLRGGSRAPMPPICSPASEKKIRCDALEYNRSSDRLCCPKSSRRLRRTREVLSRLYPPVPGAAVLAPAVI